MNNLEYENPQGETDDFIDEEVKADYRDLTESLHLSEEQAQGVWEWIVDGAKSFVHDMDMKAHEYCDETECRLRELYGRDFDRKQAAARNLVAKYGGDEFVGFLKSSGIGNCREVIEFLIKLADAAGEDRGLVGEKASALSGEEKIKSEIARLMAVPAYMQAHHPEHDSTVRQVYQLRKRLFGEE